MIRAALALVAMLALAGCGGGEAQPHETAAAAPGGGASSGVLELENVLQLRSDFEADAGKTRVLLLFSPT